MLTLERQNRKSSGSVAVSDCQPVMDRFLHDAETGEAERRAAEARRRAEAERPKSTPTPADRD